MSESLPAMAWMIDYARIYQQWLMLAVMVQQRRRWVVGYDLKTAMATLARWLMAHDMRGESTWEIWIDFCGTVAPAADVFSAWYSDLLYKQWGYA
jgi:hypothetical protein